MRIVKCEKIFLSQDEADTWENFEKILDGLYQGCENPDTTKLVDEIQDLLGALWEEVEDVE